MSTGLLLACPSHAGEFLQGFTESRIDIAILPAALRQRSNNDDPEPRLISDMPRRAELSASSKRLLRRALRALRLIVATDCDASCWLVWSAMDASSISPWIMVFDEPLPPIPAAPARAR